MSENCASAEKTGSIWEATGTIRSLLCDKPADFPTDYDDAFFSQLLAASDAHGVTALVYDRLMADNAPGRWPAAMVDLFGARARAEATRELVLKRELIHLLQLFSHAGVRPLLLKGAPLAYSLYRAPYLRTRSDTDILIGESQKELAHEILLAANYDAGVPCSRGVDSYQRTYRGAQALGIVHHVDLHWRLSNRQIFCRVFSLDELYEAALPVAALGTAAWAPGPVHALMIACLHRVGHISSPYFINGVPYCEANRLIWLYDIHLLCSRFCGADWLQFRELVSEKALCAICLDGLRAAQGCFDTQIPDVVVQCLESAGFREPSADYLRPGFWRRKLLVELRAMRSWPERFELMRDWVFPPAEHMLRKYGVRSRWLLPFLYLRRVVMGAVKAFLGRLPGDRGGGSG